MKQDYENNNVDACNLYDLNFCLSEIKLVDDNKSINIT